MICDGAPKMFRISSLKHFSQLSIFLLSPYFVREASHLHASTERTPLNLNQPSVLTKFQLKEKRPLWTLLSVWNTTRIDEPVDGTTTGALMQNLPSFVALSLEPSYSVTLSYVQLDSASKFISLNVINMICSYTATEMQNSFFFHSQWYAFYSKRLIAKLKNSLIIVIVIATTMFMVLSS